MGPLEMVGRNSAARLRKISLLTAAVLLPAILRAQIQAIPVNQESANRGAQFFAQSCAPCHGAEARGTTTGPDLIRSLVVLHDRAQQLHGAELGPLLQKPPTHNFDLTADQLADLSQFLTRTINAILRSGYSNTPTEMLSGDAKAGEAYFNGAGGCNKCHSAAGDLAGIANRFDAAAMQQRFVFPQTGGGRGRGGPAPAPAKTQVTITLPSKKTVSGALLRMDDFNVTFTDAAGVRQTVPRTPGTKVEVTDPYAAHVALLDKYTDAEVHNMTAYLETLK